MQISGQVWSKSFRTVDGAQCDGSLLDACSYLRPRRRPYCRAVKLIQRQQRFLAKDVKEKSGEHDSNPVSGPSIMA